MILLSVEKTIRRAQYYPYIYIQRESGMTDEFAKLNFLCFVNYIHLFTFAKYFLISSQKNFSNN